MCLTKHCLRCWSSGSLLCLIAALNQRLAAAADESVSATSSGRERLADSLRTSRLPPHPTPHSALHPTPSTYPLSCLLAGSLIKSPYMIPLAKGHNPSQYHYSVIKQVSLASLSCSIQIDLCQKTLTKWANFSYFPPPPFFEKKKSNLQYTHAIFATIQQTKAKHAYFFNPLHPCSLYPLYVGL